MVLVSSVGAAAEARREVLDAVVTTKPIKPAQLFGALTELFTGTAIRAGAVPTSDTLDPRTAELRPLRILLAEDNPTNQKVTVHMLARMGYRAELAKNGLEALEAVRQRQYDVVLMDVQMPEMDGLEASHRICAEFDRTRRPRIIAMTAGAMRGDREACTAAGMDDYLSKPVRPGELAAALGLAEPVRTVDDELSAEFEVLDTSSLDEIRAEGGDATVSLVRDIVREYLDYAVHQIETMRSAVGRGDAPALQSAAHTLKGSSATIGAERLASVCAEIELGGCTTAGGCDADLVTRAETELETVRQTLDRYLGVFDEAAVKK
jgi:CheY-like chemotaxis protein/HPt (histidine-containing phosphotransfer) domain-containing protein